MMADDAQFTFEVGAHSAGELRVLEFETDEALSRPYAANVTLVVRANVTIVPSDLVGEKACLVVRALDGATRYVNGVAAEVHAWEEGGREDRQRLRVRVVPRLWTLGLVRRSRIFQGMSVPEIAHSVLSAGRVPHRLDLASQYPPREYCVQYGESDLEFVSRLLEEEGIFYRFEHAADAHTMVLADAPSAYGRVPGDARLPFHEPSRLVASGEHLDRFASQHVVRPGKVSLRDYDYLRPALDLTASASADAQTDLEVYEFPGHYADDAAGKARARALLQQLRVGAETARAGGTSRRLEPGLVFELDEHPIAALNGDYVVVSARQRGRQPEVLAHGPELSPPDEDYRVELECIRADVPFRPERRTHRPILAGPQTAVVTGPGGEEIYCDEHGRIKVQFHWDREGAKDDRSSCWMRVSQAWAGPGWGALYLPRIGQEVVVEFLEGDPDRPLITGAVYNGMNPPPLNLPAEKTRSTLRSSSSPGGNGSNELRFEDAKDAEEVYLHAQRDLTIVVENDKKQTIGGNEQLLVEKDRARTIAGNQALEVRKDDTSKVGGNQALEVGGSRSVSVGGDHTESVAGGQSIGVRGALSVTVGTAAMETVALAKALTVGAAYAVTVGGAMTEIVGGIKAEEVGAAKVEAVLGDKTERVGGNRLLEVAGDLSETVGKGRTTKIGKDLVVNVGGSYTHSAKDAYTLKAKEIVLSAEDSFVAKIGSAVIEVKKSGDIVIKGAKFEVKASGDIVLKGANLGAN